MFHFLKVLSFLAGSSHFVVSRAWFAQHNTSTELRESNIYKPKTKSLKEHFEECNIGNYVLSKIIRELNLLTNSSVFSFLI